MENHVKINISELERTYNTINSSYTAIGNSVINTNAYIDAFKKKCKDELSLKMVASVNQIIDFYINSSKLISYELKYISEYIKTMKEVK